MKKIRELLIASGNEGKIKEISNLLKEINIKAISASNFNLEEPIEDGSDFTENAAIKAKYYAKKTGYISLSDDSGIVIDLLNGDPGIYSARWAIDNITGKKDFNIAFARILKELSIKKIDHSKTEIAAHFICDLALFDPESENLQSFSGRVDGYLTFPPKGNRGFGYDPIFIANYHNMEYLNKFLRNSLKDKTFAEIDPEIKEQISHRAMAFKKLVQFLNVQ